MNTLDYISIEVAYAGASRQVVLLLRVPSTTSIKEAILMSDILSLFPELGLLETLKDRIGVFGERKPFEYILQEGDRVEIYRPLPLDPKIARRKRAKEAVKLALAQKKERHHSHFTK